MGRQRRPIFAGATYHVMNRGNRKAAIFEDDRDRHRFAALLADYLRIHRVEFLGGCLMKNHFHLSVTTAEPNLGDFMESLEGQYARYSNWRHKRSGHLFQGRYREVLIQDDYHLMTAMSYVFMNPVCAGLSAKPEDYRWSTCRAAVGLANPPSYLSLRWVAALFPARSLRDSQALLHTVMNSGAPAAGYAMHHELDVSPDAVHRVLQSYTGSDVVADNLPIPYRQAMRPPNVPQNAPNTSNLTRVRRSPAVRIMCRAVCSSAGDVQRGRHCLVSTSS